MSDQVNVGTSLVGADLSRCNLQGAYLNGANMLSVKLENTILVLSLIHI